MRNRKHRFIRLAYAWFSLHPSVAVNGIDSNGLKQFLRYKARSSMSLSQLSNVTPEDPDRGEEGHMPTNRVILFCQAQECPATRNAMGIGRTKLSLF